MKNYEIYFQELVTYVVHIKAESQEEALEKFKEDPYIHRSKEVASESYGDIECQEESSSTPDLPPSTDDRSSR